MAEIDSLEISIQSNIDKVNKNLDVLISKMGVVAKGISAIGNNKGLQEFAKSTKTISESIGNVGTKVSQSMKPVQEQAKKVSKTIDQTISEISEKYKDLGKGFKFEGTTEQMRRESAKLFNSLEKAKVDLQKIKLSDNVDTSKLEKSVAKVMELQNKYESLQAVLEEGSRAYKEGLKAVEEQANRMNESLQSAANETKDFNEALGQVGIKTGVKNAKAELEEYTRLLENAKSQKKDLETLGATEGKPYLEAIKNISLYENKIKEISKELNIKVNADGINTAREKIEELQKIFSESGKDFVFSGNAEQLDKEIQKVTSELDKLYSRQDRAIELGKVDTTAFKELIRDIENAINRLGVLEATRPEALNRTLEENAKNARNATNQLKQFEANLQQLRVPPVKEDNLKKLQNALKKTEADLAKLRTKLANGLTLGKITQDIDDSAYRNLREQIVLTEKQAEALREKIGNTSGFERLKQSMSGVAASAKPVNKAFSSLYATLKKLNSGINSILAKIGKFIKSMFLLGTAAKSSGKGFDLNLKTILKYGFGIRSVYALVNKLRNAIKEGMKNLVQYSAETNASVSMLVSSLATLKNASAAAASPLLNAIAPALNQLIQLFIRATNAVNQFLSALMGRGTWIKAKDQIIDYAGSISDASKAAKGALQPFDKLNNLTSQQAAGGGADIGDMFETLPIEDKFKDLADKIKDILSKLFAPLKEAWNREGKFVIDSWKYGLKEVWKLIKDIGRDFLEVWQQEKTIKIFEDILHIIGDIGLVIGHLARNFRDAWNENKTGLHILENIRDIIGVIVHNIRLAADKTVEWADKLNFSPLLESFERFTESLIPVADALSGILTDFYTEVLLPLGKWTIEKGLPELLDVFTAFNEKVDWQALRDNLAEFWEHLEPFAETVGEGLIIFIERVSDALADFLNSQEFKDFLARVEEWMDKVTPEDVADGIEKLAKAFIAFKVACVALKAILAGFDFASKLALISNALGLFSGAGAGGGAFSGLAVSLSPLSSILIAVGAGLAYVFATNEEVRESFGNAIAQIQEGLQPALQLITETIIPSLKDGFSRLLEILTPLGEFLEGAFTSIWQDMINPALSYVGETVLPKLTETFENFWNNVLVPFASFLGDVLEPVIKIVSDVLQMLWENVVVPLADTVGNVLSKAFEGLCEIFNNTVVPIVNTVIEVLQFLWNNVLEPIVSFIWDNFKPTIESAFEAIKGIIDGVSEVLGGLIDFITGVFTGNWEKAWEGVKSIFKGIFNGVVSIIEGAINIMIGGINGFLAGFDKVSSAISSITGINISIPKIPTVSLPKFATGAIVYKATYAEIGEAGKEGILPLTNRAAMSQMVDEIMASAGGYNRYGESGEIGGVTGITDAIRSAGSTEAKLLQMAIEILQEIANKPTISDGDIFNSTSKQYNEKAKRNGYSRDPVFG